MTLTGKPGGRCYRAAMPLMSQITRSVLAISALAALSPTLAQGARITPQSIIVNPAPSDLNLGVGVDRSGDNPGYAIGDQIRVSVTPNQDAYVYIFSIHADGVIDLVLPNRYSGGEALVKANETRYFPPKNAAFRFTIGGPVGQDKVLAVAAKHALNISEIAQFEGNAPLATVKVQGQDNLARALSIVVEQIPPADWITDVTYYRVVGTGAATGSTTPSVTPRPQPTPAPSNSSGALTAADFVQGFDNLFSGQTVTGVVPVGPRLVLKNRTVNNVGVQRVHFSLVDSSGWTVWQRDESTQGALCLYGNGNSSNAACYPWDVRSYQSGDYRLNSELNLSNGAKVNYSQKLHINEQGGAQTFAKYGDTNIPVYPGANFEKVKTSKNGGNSALLTASFKVSGSLGSVGSYYLNYMVSRHWNIKSTDIQGNKYWFEAGKDGLRVRLEVKQEGGKFSLRLQLGN